MTDPRPSTHIAGYAVTSADGFIADAVGAMPDALKFEADWAYFQNALDQANITLLGRRTHEAAPNVRQRRRLVVSSRVRKVQQEDDTTFWVNPEDVDPSTVFVGLAGAKARIAVVGGTGVFDWILASCGFSEFHISLAHHVRLGAGRPLLSGIRDLDDAVSKLERRGLVLRQHSWFDQEAGLELLVYGIV